MSSLGIWDPVVTVVLGASSGQKDNSISLCRNYMSTPTSILPRPKGWICARDC